MLLVERCPAGVRHPLRRSRPHPLTLLEFDPPAGAFFVGYLDDAPGDDRAPGAAGPDVPRSAPAVRGGQADVRRRWPRGGRASPALMLAHLEGTASAAGADVIVLQTGTAQPEAMALYESVGLHRRSPAFGFSPGRADPGASASSWPRPGRRPGPCSGPSGRLGEGLGRLSPSVADASRASSRRAASRLVTVGDGQDADDHDQRGQRRHLRHRRPAPGAPSAAPA